MIIHQRGKLNLQWWGEFCRIAGVTSSGEGMRKALRLLIMATAIASMGIFEGLWGPAYSQDWPVRPIKIISPFAAGGPTDTLARPVADHLTKSLGQPVTIENRPGAGTTIGAQAVARAEPDGYTLLIGTTSPFAIAPAVFAKAGYTALAFAPVVLMAEAPMVLNVSVKSGARTIAEFVDAARKMPDAFSYASVGVGTSPHLLGERFNQIAGTKMAHVPYRGGGPAMTDLISGQVQAFFEVTSNSIPNIEAGNIRALMVLHTKRSPRLPDVPSAVEAGFPDFVSLFWVGLAAPAGTPRPIVERINREVNQMLAMPHITDLLSKLQVTPVGGPPEALTTRITREGAVWKAVAAKAGVRID